MLTPRLLTLCLLLSAIPPVHAQSATTPLPPRLNRSASSLRSLAPMQFGAPTPTPPPTTPALSLPNPFKPTPPASFTLSTLTLNRLSDRTLLSPAQVLLARLLAGLAAGQPAPRRPHP